MALIEWVDSPVVVEEKPTEEKAAKKKEPKAEAKEVKREEPKAKAEEKATEEPKKKRRWFGRKSEGDK
jgi:hypothetical protein